MCHTIRYMGFSLVLILGSCGGGSSGGLPSPDNDTGVVDDDGACNNSYYRQLFGTYEGVVSYQNGEITGVPDRMCEWDVELVIAPKSQTISCTFSVNFRTIGTELIVHEATSDLAYRCPDQNTVISNPRDPNSALSPANLYEEIEFPVVLGMPADPTIPDIGPYTSEDSVLVPYERLLGDTSPLADSLLIGSDNTLELRYLGTRFYQLEGTLRK